MSRILPLLGLLVAGCGTAASEGSAPSPSTATAASVPPATSEVDGRMPYAQRGDK